MRIAITGHTNGLGKAFFEHFSVQGHDVIGMSRSTGYDVVDTRSSIVEIAKTCDLFFNNVHHATTQAEYIKELCNSTKLITSGSMGADYAHTGNLYYAEKLIIQQAHRAAQQSCQFPILLLKMGYLENHPEKRPIRYNEICNAVDFWLLNPRCTMIEFGNIT